MLRRAFRLGFRHFNPAAEQARGAHSVITYVPSPGDARVQPVTLIPGDGIGPEVSGAVEKVVAALKAPIAWEKSDQVSGMNAQGHLVDHKLLHVLQSTSWHSAVQIRFDQVSGSDAQGHPVDHMPPEVLESIKRTGVCLKGTLFSPLTKYNTSTQSLNVQLRKQLDLHVNLVHGFSLPGVPTRHDNINIAVIRENTEGEYSGLEHEVVTDVVESIKVITREKSRRTAEYAFGYAFLNHRKKVTAIHKANIMKMSDGLFLREFREVAKLYPTIKAEEMIVDNTCMQLTGKPHQFDVMVTPNLYGNLVANVVAGLVGGPGVLPGVNVGEKVAIFEQGARHVGRDIAGKGLANPCAALLSTAMMLRHLNLPDFCDRLEQAVLDTVAGPPEHKTRDIGGTGTTDSFTQAVIDRLT